MPAMPRVILSGVKFHETYHREHVYDMVSAGMDYLDAVEVTMPTKLRKPTKIPSLRKTEKFATTPKNLETLPISESEGEVADNSEGCDYYLNSRHTDLTHSTKKPCTKLRSTPSGVRPQHLYWDNHGQYLE